MASLVLEIFAHYRLRRQRIESAQKIHEVEVNVKCIQTNFGGCSLPGFGDFAPFLLPSEWPNFPFRPWTIVHGGQKIESAQKIHANRGQYDEMHANQIWWAWLHWFWRLCSFYFKLPFKLPFIVAPKLIHSEMFQ